MSDLPLHRTMQDDEIDRLKAQLKETEEKGRVLMDMCRDFKRRVAELEGRSHVKQLASLMRGLEVKPGFGSMPPEGFYALGRAIADQAKAATEPAILRKQAGAVEKCAEGLTDSRSQAWLMREANQLRNQAAEAERAGGEK